MLLCLCLGSLDGGYYFLVGLDVLVWCRLYLLVGVVVLCFVLLRACDAAG